MSNAMEWPTLAELADANGVVDKVRDGNQRAWLAVDGDGETYTVVEASPHARTVRYDGPDAAKALQSWFAVRGRWAVADGHNGDGLPPLVAAWYGANQ